MHATVVDDFGYQLVAPVGEGLDGFVGRAELTGTAAEWCGGLLLVVLSVGGREAR